MGRSNDLCVVCRGCDSRYRYRSDADFFDGGAGRIINSAEGMSSFLKPFGGLGNMFVGLYPGAIGETSALVILVVGVILAIRKVIDWRVPATYLITLFVLGAGVGMMHGAPISYALFHLLTGGAMFGAVFMMTDPVTNPTSAAGRIMFAIGCAVITIVLRLRSNLPEGVMYSILIMNMLTPWIESLTDGQQIKMKSKNIRNLVILFAAGLAITLLVGSTIKPVAAGSAEAGQPTVPTTYNSKQHGFQGDNQLKWLSIRPRVKFSVKMTNSTIHGHW
ncbi:MAG: RnfABCDGE type electron transport complex subunit D [Holdemania massiliensis]